MTASRVRLVPLVWLLALLVCVSAVQPVRRRIQRPIDRRFSRAGADAQRGVDALSTAVRDEVDLSRLRESAVATASEAVHPAGAGLWLRRPAG